MHFSGNLGGPSDRRQRNTTHHLQRVFAHSFGSKSHELVRVEPEG